MVVDAARELVENYNKLKRINSFGTEVVYEFYALVGEIYKVADKGKQQIEIDPMHYTSKTLQSLIILFREEGFNVNTRIYDGAIDSVIINWE